MRAGKVREGAWQIVLGVLAAVCALGILSTKAPPPAGTPQGTATPTYSVDGLIATTEAIMQIIPSATPNPDLPPDKQLDVQQNDLRRRAASTAVALYPPPRDIYGLPSPAPPPR